MKRGKPAKKYSQAARVHDIIRLIEARHGMTVDELAEETCVTRRTIQRDLVVLHDAGYPLVAEREGANKVYRFISRFRDIPPVSFTLKEIATLYLLRGHGGGLNGTPFEGELEELFLKIRSVLPPRFAAHIERIAGVPIPLLLGRRDYTPFSAILLQLRDALVHQSTLTVSYKAHGRDIASTYRVDPYSLAFYKGGIYLIGHAHNRNALRTFAVERISSVVVEKERFEMPEDYLPEERLSSAFGIVAEETMEVKIRFSAVVAEAVKSRIWHPSQKFSQMEDGSVELVFTAGGKMEIISWVLSYGEHAELLAPLELREAVIANISGLKKVYSQ